MPRNNSSHSCFSKCPATIAFHKIRLGHSVEHLPRSPQHPRTWHLPPHLQIRDAATAPQPAHISTVPPIDPSFHSHLALRPNSAIKKARKAPVTKKRTYAAAGSGSSAAMAEMPPHGHQEGKKSPGTKKRSYADAGSSSSVAMAETPPHGPNHIQPPGPPLPPGVYFSPTPHECLGLLNRWIDGDNEMRDARGFLFPANVYGESPDALRRRHPQASIREHEHAWWFLGETRFKFQTAGGGTSNCKYAHRHVGQAGAGGSWRVEGSKEKLGDNGFKNNLAFYVDGLEKRSRRTNPWLMQEFTSVNDDGAGKLGVPTLYRLYLTANATDDQLKDLFGEDGVKHGPDGEKKPARAIVPKDYFNATIAELLLHESVRGGGVQEHVPAAEAPEGLVDYRSQQEHDLDQDEQLPYYRRDLTGHHEPVSVVPPMIPPRSVRASPSLPAAIAGEPPTDNITVSTASVLCHIRPELINAQYEPLSVIPPPIAPPASPSLLAESACLNQSLPPNFTVSTLRYIGPEMLNAQPAEESVSPSACIAKLSFWTLQ